MTDEIVSAGSCLSGSGGPYGGLFLAELSGERSGGPAPGRLSGAADSSLASSTVKVNFTGLSGIVPLGGLGPVLATDFSRPGLHAAGAMGATRRGQL